MKRLLLAGAALIVFAAPAYAADIPVKAPSMVGKAPAAAKWSGCYVGLHGGYGWGDAQDKSPVFIPRNLDPEGYFAGGQIGCNYQTQPNWVWGLEADVAGANISEHDQFLGGANPNIQHKIKGLASVRARAGWANGSQLWYLTGGWGWARSERTTQLPGFGFFQTRSATHDGWVLGVGYEQLLSQNWTLKLEYLYYDLGKKSYNYSDFGQPGIDLSLHTVKFGVNYRF